MPGRGSTRVSTPHALFAFHVDVVVFFVAAEYVLDTDLGRDILYVYDKLNSYKVVQEAQAAFPSAGAYFHNTMRCLIFPLAGADVLRWLQDCKRIVMTEKADFEGASRMVEPLSVPDDL